MNQNSNTSPQSGTSFKGKDPSLMKPAKAVGSQSGSGPRKKSTPND